MHSLLEATLRSLDPATGETVGEVAVTSESAIPAVVAAPARLRPRGGRFRLPPDWRLWHPRVSG